MAMGSRVESEAGVSVARPRRILFIDAYDSFTNNIVSLLQMALGVEVFVIRIDLSTLEKTGDQAVDGDSSGPGRWTEAEFVDNLAQFDAVVCGPGPGSPLNPDDVGAFRLLWHLPPHLQVPVLGICLGFQSLVAAHGGEIRRLQRGLHGMVREIEHRDDEAGDIFDAVPGFKATLYHSLCADIGQHDAPDVPYDEWRRRERWLPTTKAPELQPLAWATETREDGRGERILMGVRHVSKPFWGLQYHLESVCTEPAAHMVLENWFRAALRWNEARRPRRVRDAEPLLDIRTLSPPNHLEAVAARRRRDGRWTDGALRDIGRDCEYTHRTMPLPRGVGVSEVVEALGLAAGEAIVLDSSSSKNGDPLALSSIVALDVEAAPRFEFHASHDFVTVRLPGLDGDEDRVETLRLDGGAISVWEVLSEFWEARSHPPGSADIDSPFKGGFMGFITYEMGLQGLDKRMLSADRGHERPDVCLAWVSKSLVIDHRAGVAHVQHLRPRGSNDEWLVSVAEKLQACHAWVRSGHNGVSGHVNGHTDGQYANGHANGHKGSLQNGHINPRTKIHKPCPTTYEEKVQACQDYIAAGESYELCLTSQTTMTRPRERQFSVPSGSHQTNQIKQERSPWSIYQTLRKRQPAPFGSFVRLGGATLLSSSPERFLSHSSSGLCSMRPMKGTVRKSEAVSTLAQAEKILHIPKEEAENLMIVDLVRHDLHGVCGVGNVTVPDLMKVEEYATVFQMITVVNGQLPGYQGGKIDGIRHRGFDSLCPYTGLDALAVALPPGSMTGAPKKRSCEILQVIEGNQERSLYSGVVGYMDVTGAGDWSVTIRTMFKWDDEEAPPDAAAGETEPREVWRIGAGGAVTILSTPEGERDEMFTKLAGPMGVFRDAA
ncbi:ADC synthase [Dactylonectria estremocensis]|uniref:aminodeoxychorismate synthase n=1 Tax=Dactylonectria estremocensis TaxID=1079267 RepID=A0A9P9JCG9_9HYPO|nr:ADC synthase [Dactylonectria estremocensis]